MRELHDLMHEGGANNGWDRVIMHEPKASALSAIKTIIGLPECVKPCNSQVMCDLTVLELSSVTFVLLCLTVATVLPPTHGKVCSKKHRARQSVLYAI